LSITPWEQPIVPKLKRRTVESLIARGTRLDGRKLGDYRQIVIEPGYVDYRAEGSALVKLGSTVVLAGVKMDLVAPFPDAPNEAVLVVHAEFVPLASPTFEPGPPDENAIELARVIDRSLREPKVVALDKLVLEPGKTVWRIFVDLYVLNHDGNLFDASMLASMAALMVTRIPSVVKTEEGYQVDRSKYVGLLPVNRRVVTVTLARLAGKLIVDPTFEEENLAETRLVIAVTDDGMIGGMQKTGMEGLTEKELEAALNMALERSKLLFNALDKFVAPYRRRLEEEIAKQVKAEEQVVAVARREAEEPAIEEHVEGEAAGQEQGEQQ
jgi:exosome complex component RRP42